MDVNFVLDVFFSTIENCYIPFGIFCNTEFLPFKEEANISASLFLFFFIASSRHKLLKIKAASEYTDCNGYHAVDSAIGIRCGSRANPQHKLGGVSFQN